MHLYTINTFTVTEMLCYVIYFIFLTRTNFLNTLKALLAINVDYLFIFTCI